MAGGAVGPEGLSHHFMDTGSEEIDGKPASFKQGMKKPRRQQAAVRNRKSVKNQNLQNEKGITPGGEAMKLEGKVALITGGARGIGAAIARRFIEDGAKVVVADIREYLLMDCARNIISGNLATCAGDVTKFDDVKKMVDETILFGQRIDILVNNAGIDDFGSVLDVDIDTWKKILDINLTGPFLCMRAAIPHMLRQGGGSIISVASLAGVRCMRCMPAYCASKGGLIQLALQVAMEYGPQKIRSNVVAPGATRTEMLAKSLGADSVTGADDTFKLMAESVPLRRAAAPEEIAGACSFLACEDSSFMTGAVLMVDGGAAIVDVADASLARSGSGWGS
jgi:meso-butanediol dehydrogenase / (S,S)-butanediol dehydrogenase / diacetyl reductase